MQLQKKKKKFIKLCKLPNQTWIHNCKHARPTNKHDISKTRTAHHKLELPECSVSNNLSLGPSKEAVHSRHDLRGLVAHKLADAMLCISLPLRKILKDPCSSVLLGNPAPKFQHNINTNTRKFNNIEILRERPVPDFRVAGDVPHQLHAEDANSSTDGGKERVNLQEYDNLIMVSRKSCLIEAKDQTIGGFGGIGMVTSGLTHLDAIGAAGWG